MKKALFFLLALGLLFGVFRTASGENLLVVSDLHLTEGSDALTPVLQALKETAQDADGLILLGDNTNNAKPAEHAAILQWAEEMAQENGTEIYILPGNHDLRASFDQAEFARMYGSYGADSAFSRDASSASCAVITRGGACLLLMDTNGVNEAGGVLPNGAVSDAAVRWAEETLSALPEGTPVIACGHHPILPSARQSRTPGAEALANVLKAHGVSLYLCGHDHGFATVRKDGLRQIIVGQSQSYPGWLGTVTVEGEKLCWRVQSLFSQDSPMYLSLCSGAEALAQRMGAGTLKGTAYEDDPGAIQWFADAFLHFSGGDMTPELCEALLQDENCQKWREIETPTVVKDWILGLLTHCPEDVREICFQ